MIKQTTWEALMTILMQNNIPYIPYIKYSDTEDENRKKQMNGHDRETGKEKNEETA